MKKTFTILIAAIAAILMMAQPNKGLGQTATKTEGFEHASTTSTYNSTYTVNATGNSNYSDCGIGWSIYYGCVSTTNYISGSRSAHMRYYTSSSSNLGYAKTTTGVTGLTNVSFNARVSNTTNQMGIWYNTDGGDTWTAIATGVTFETASTSTPFSYNIPNSSLSTTYYIKIGISSASTNKAEFIIDDVVFTYATGSTPTVNTPQIVPNGGSFYPTQEVQLSCTTDGASIYYTTDGTAPSTSSTLYSSAFTINSSCTIKVIATKSGMTNSNVAEATFTKITPYANIAALTANTETGTYYVTFTNATVTYTNGNYAYIQDASGAVAMYKSSHGLTAGDVLNGTATVSYQLNNGNPQITNLSGVESESGSAPDPETVVASAWDYTFNDVLNQYFKITDASVTYTNSKYYVTLGSSKATETVQLYKPIGDALSLNTNSLYTIIGFPMLYVKNNNTTKELQVFVMPMAADIIIENSELEISYEENDNGSIAVDYSYFEPTDVVATLYSDEECTQAFPTSGPSAWIVLDDMADPFDEISYIVSENTGNEDRTVYMEIVAENTNGSMISEVFEITQVFHQTYSVTYKANGGTGDDVVDSPYNYNATVTVKPNNGTGTNPGFTNPGYDFQNWNTAANGYGTSYDPADNEHNTFNITANTNLFAQWQAIPYNLNKAAMTNGDVSFKVNTTTVTQATIGQTVTIVVSPASGYKLSNLTVTNDATSGTVTVTNSTFTMPASSVTVSATFEVKYSYDIDFESAANTYTNWTFTNMTSAIASDSDVTAHGGSKFGTTGGNSTASITTNSKIATPVSLTCYVSKKSTNTTASSWKIQVSSNGSTWDDVGDAQSATSMDKGKWVEFTRDLSSYSNVYVRVYYGSNTAVRCIDDLSLEYTPAQEYTLTVTSVANIDIKATVGSTDVTEGHTLDVEAAKTVNLTVVSEDENYQFDEWVVYKTGDENTTVTVTNNSFTMPEYAVTVSATTKEVRTITYSVNGTTSSTAYDKGTVVELAAPVSGIPAQFTFVGWTANPANTTDGDLVTSHTANSNATFYAVFKKNNSIILTGDDFSSYDDPEAEAKMQGLTWGRYYVMKNGGIQFKKADQGYFYNKTPIKNLTTIIATRKSGTTYKVTIKAGSSENPTSASALSPSTSSQVDTYTISGNEYVRIQNLADATPVYTSFEFRFTGDNTRYTHIMNENITEPIDISSITDPIIIPAGAVVNAGSNITNTTAANLVIEDGGQLICSNSVAATFKKTMTAPSAKDGDDVYGWELISSPVHDGNIDGTNAEIAVGHIENLITDPATNYDMFSYDEEYSMWRNQKASSNASGFGSLKNGQGYMYRNNGQELSFVGNTNVETFTKDLTYTSDADDLAGFHLVGNPYSESITLLNTTLLNATEQQLGTQLSAYYILKDNGSAWKTDLAANTPIANKQGFLIQIPSDAKKIQFSRTARTAKSHGDNIKFMVANSQFEDVTYALFDNALPLNKIDHRNPAVPMIYINQNNQDYAVATMTDDTKAFNLNFKAGTMGKYTFSYKADGNFDYIHVIDRMTGEDIDMLLEGEYTFLGTPNDNVNRFIVKLGYNAGNEISENEIFAYQSGNDIVVSGEGELQVFDVMGRMVMTQRINGVETINIPTNGMYIFRLNEKVQKIVVE